jgi:hypothetical protein
MFHKSDSNLFEVVSLHPSVLGWPYRQKQRPVPEDLIEVQFSEVPKASERYNALLHTRQAQPEQLSLLYQSSGV